MANPVDCIRGIAAENHDVKRGVRSDETRHNPPALIINLCGKKRFITGAPVNAGIPPGEFIDDIQDILEGRRCGCVIEINVKSLPAIQKGDFLIQTHNKISSVRNKRRHEKMVLH
jgi:hypothetical protein